jgi:hypothetical protein
VPPPSQREGGGYTGALHKYENSELILQPEVHAQLVFVVAATGQVNEAVR